MIDKFSNRYPNDPGLQKIRKQFNEYLENPTRDKLDRIKTNLEKLIHSRKLGSYGGLDYLTYLRDRRPRYNMYVFMR
ncbi:MAG TPA: hypothetical protein EYP86_04415 [Candidatus Altiarchaeales archaeon]|nr:hypothetical protein [Candidatus Altiarchaeales archaeon]